MRTNAYGTYIAGNLRDEFNGNIEGGLNFLINAVERSENTYLKLEGINNLHVSGYMFGTRNGKLYYETYFNGRGYAAAKFVNDYDIIADIVEILGDTSCAFKLIFND